MHFTTSYSENTGSISSWSNSPIKSPVANDNASLVFPDIPLFSPINLYLILESFE